ncbi:MAG: Ppx/GppA family phosphatase [Candidatus Rokubacteria bacterium]|nr:Ppx/GppA family phosphatase [Candidatus Rokubacteria bacterium]MBI3825361.1 Ppx/GppA family phosphatase [Candidatus Rokubacteria bacterium]
MRLATVDLGTNTVRLLVVEAGARRHGPADPSALAASRDTSRVLPDAWRTLAAEQRVTRLGEGLAASGRLGEAAMARTAATVTDYVARARAAGAAVRVVATSAVREAANGGAFARALQAATGVAVEVVSGEDEARLTLRGATAGLGPGGTILVFDIGGGSTEYILAREGYLLAAVSLRLGVVPLAERYPFPDRVPPERYAALRGEVAARLERELPAALRAARVEALIGTAGTVTTLAALDLGLTAYDAARVQGHTLTRAAVARLRERLAGLTVAERAALPCLEPGRADLIVPGTAIVEATLDVLALDALRVSDWGLREGMMLEALEKRA